MSYVSIPKKVFVAKGYKLDPIIDGAISADDVWTAITDDREYFKFTLSSKRPQMPLGGLLEIYMHTSYDVMGRSTTAFYLKPQSKNDVVYELD